jgi:dGTPase
MKPLYNDKDSDRLKDIGQDPHRTAFRRDNGRLIHSAVFRRLQGKTQLFPSYESDFFRNRLSHSLEVAQIAKGIAEQINDTEPYFKANPIDKDLVETAALAHDLGHPPFGHNGEKALDDMMKKYGGFEGNAQTLRILSKLEKKDTLSDEFVPVKGGKDLRCGLNLAYRTLAAILKYDRQIPKNRGKASKLVKGYYYTEDDVVKKIKRNVLGPKVKKKIKTIECSIMDLADDIAYSTYDLEDAFKAEFLSPMGMLANEEEFLIKLTEKVREGLKNRRIAITEAEVVRILWKVYREIFDEEMVNDIVADSKKSKIIGQKELMNLAVSFGAIDAFDFSNRICRNGYFRTQHTSKLVNKFMSNIQVKLDPRMPALSEVQFEKETGKQVEVLKRYTFYTVIQSPRLKVPEFRGYEIVKEIFETLTDREREGYNLLPEDFRYLYDNFKSVALKKRVICDFIAGMTDRYAVEFYARLKSENPQTIFKPF